MPDSGTPQHDSERNGADRSSPGAHADDHSPVQRDQGEAPTAVEPQGTDGRGGPSSPDDSRTSGLDRVKQLAQSRAGVWAAVAVLCAAAGTAAAVVGAHAVARGDGAKARTAFGLSSAEIASNLKAAIQREEDLVISTSTFFAGNPKTSSAEFAAWTRWAQTLRRYPELERLGLVALVRPPEPAALETASTNRAAGAPGLQYGPLGTRTAPLGTRSATLGTRAATPAVASPGVRAGSLYGGALRVVPVKRRPLQCVVVAELSRSTFGHPGLGHCPPTPALLSLRDSGQSSYAATSVGRTGALGIQTPVYKGGVPPSTVAARMGAFVGSLREVLAPTVVLQQALRGHPEDAVRLRHRTSSSNVVFTSGTPQPGAQTSVTRLQGGWSAKTFGPPAGAGVFDNGNALALLIAGTLASVLLGVLIFVLGGGGGRGPVRVPKPRARPKVPHEDLYDPLTGLPNRALMLDRAERMLARAGRQSGLLVGALFIDIDWFDDFNDKLGHDAGDQLLTIVAKRLEGVIRAHDTVGRLGGDEFVVLVESAARGVRLDSLARRVIEALHKPVEIDGFGPSFYLTASIGVAFGRYATPDDLLRDAQLALYSAKAAGKDRYTLFNANMRSVIEGRGVLEVEMNTALQEQQFFLLYEPICDLSSRKVVGVEALIRWQHPTQGVLEPADFIPLAEENGLIVPIGRWALEQACGRAAAWNVAGHRVGISVKVSATQLNRDGFVTDVRRALQQSGIDPSLLTLEIGEGTVMRDVGAAAARLQEIKDLGVCIAIDDFGGSGYAYHSDLRLLPLDFLKVDRSSLSQSDDEDYRSWLLEAILIVGRDLSLTVIATDIDTYEQMNRVQAMGCTLAQGSFTGEPKPADAVEHLFDADLPEAHTTPTSPLP